MTLPKLLSMALSRQSSDESLRHVYALHGYKVECASDQRHLLLTLSVDRDFDVAFAISLAMITSLARDLSGGLALLEAAPPPRPN